MYWRICTFVASGLTILAGSGCDSGGLSGSESGSVQEASHPEGLLFDGESRVGVWLQAVTDVSLQGWADLGVDMYIGHWDEFTQEDQLLLEAYDIPYVLNVGQFAGDALPGAVMIDHEPDLHEQVPIDELLDRAAEYKASGGTSPVYIYFGKGISVESWAGLGPSNGEPWSGASAGFEYYKRVAESPFVDGFFFDYYPFNAEPTTQYTPDCPSGCLVENDPQLVVDGLQRLKAFSGGKPVYPTLSCSRSPLELGSRAPTLEQTGALVDALLDNGADGIIWFAHEFDNGDYVTDRYPLTAQGQSDGTADMVRTINERVQQYFLPEK